MKVGDRVKILAPIREGDHAYEGETGVIVRNLAQNVNGWDFEVSVDNNDERDDVVFFATELEVIV